MVLIKKALLHMISRIVGFKAIRFDGSHIFLLGVPMIVLSSESLSYLQHELVDRIGLENTFSIMYKLGKLQGYNGSSIFIKKFNINADESYIPFFLEQTKLIGLGNFQIIDLRYHEKRGRIKYLNSPHARKYKEQFGTQQNAVDFYQVGLLAGGFEAIMETKSEAYELTCLAWNNDSCEILLKQAEEINKNDSELLDYYRNTNLEELKKADQIYTVKSLLTEVKYSKEATESELSRYLKKRYHNKIFSFGNDELNILGISGLITPMDVVAMLTHILLTHYKGDVEEILYETGKKTSSPIAEKLLGELKLEKNTRSYHLLLGLVGFYGFGKVKVNNINLEKNQISVIVYDNAMAREYLKLMRSSHIKIDYFLSGFISGITDIVFGLDLNFIEKKCMANNSQYCLFESF